MMLYRTVHKADEPGGLEESTGAVLHIVEPLPAMSDSRQDEQQLHSVYSADVLAVVDCLKCLPQAVLKRVLILLIKRQTSGFIPSPMEE